MRHVSSIPAPPIKEEPSIKQVPSSFVKFMKGSFPLEKYAIDEYLKHAFNDMVKARAAEIYELPSATQEEDRLVDKQFPVPKYSKDIFANPKVARRFIKILEDNFSNNGRSSFSYTCRCCAELDVFSYPSDLTTKTGVQKSKALRACFSGVLDKWAKTYADFYVSTYPEVHEALMDDQKIKELAELKRLAKKHGMKLG